MMTEGLDFERLYHQVADERHALKVERAELLEVLQELIERTPCDPPYKESRERAKALIAKALGEVSA